MKKLSKFWSMLIALFLVIGINQQAMAQLLEEEMLEAKDTAEAALEAAETAQLAADCDSFAYNQLKDTVDNLKTERWDWLSPTEQAQFTALYDQAVADAASGLASYADAVDGYTNADANLQAGYYFLIAAYQADIDGDPNRALTCSLESISLFEAAATGYDGIAADFDCAAYDFQGAASAMGQCKTMLENATDPGMGM